MNSPTCALDLISSYHSRTGLAILFSNSCIFDFLLDLSHLTQTCCSFPTLQKQQKKNFSDMLLLRLVIAQFLYPSLTTRSLKGVRILFLSFHSFLNSLKLLPLFCHQSCSYYAHQRCHVATQWSVISLHITYQHHDIAEHAFHFNTFFFTWIPGNFTCLIFLLLHWLLPFSFLGDFLFISLTLLPWEGTQT